MESLAAAPALGDAPPHAWHRRRRPRLIAAALLLLVAAGVALFAWVRYGPWLDKRSAMLSAQRACLEYSPAPDSAVFRQDADVTYDAKPWSQPSLRQPNVPPAWQNYHARHVAPFSSIPNSSIQSQGTLFLHERRSPGGFRKLVAVELRVVWHRQGTTFQAAKRAIEPGTLRREPRETWGGPTFPDRSKTNLVGQTQDLFQANYGSAVRFLPGVPDPADPSRFTIDYEVGDRRETIDGRLDDDDSVTLKLRNADDAKRKW